MAEASTFLAAKRYPSLSWFFLYLYVLFVLLIFYLHQKKKILPLRVAVVTGANKGIGFELCRNLASKGIMVVLTSRDEKKGLEAFEKLKDSGLSDHLVFHQLDVTVPSSIASLVDYVQSKFGKLDILVNHWPPISSNVCSPF